MARKAKSRRSITANDLEKRRALVATSALGVGASAGIAYPLVSSMQPSERARAFGSPVNVNVSLISPGELQTVTWRGRPVWILNRTDSMLAQLKRGSGHLADPGSHQSQQPKYATNEQRSIQPRYFVAIAICTHLGCIPSFRPKRGDATIDPDWPGGFFCPCHGSKFDLAGRVYKNVPAPTNLVIPPHRYEEDAGLIIG